MSDEEKKLLNKGWYQFLQSSSKDTSYDENCSHIVGYDKMSAVGSEDEEFRLSMLQRITARRVLDYQEIKKSVSVYAKQVVV